MTSSQRKTKQGGPATENTSRELGLLRFYSSTDLYFPTGTDHGEREMTKYTAVHRSETETRDTEEKGII